MSKDRYHRPPKQLSPAGQTASRTISLSWPFFLIISLILVYIISLVIPKSMATPLSSALTRVQKYPLAISHHTTLADTYYQLGDLLQARAEILIIQDLLLQQTASPPLVLGDMTSFSDVSSKITTQPESYKKTRDFWLEVTTLHPTYRDAWIQLLYHAYNAGDVEEVHRLVDIVKNLDPNYQLSFPQTIQ